MTADIDGDGADELLVATSQKQLAAYDAGGKRLWHHVYDGEIHDLAAADLDEDGKSEALCYLDTEKLHRVSGDGSEWPVGDVNTVCTSGVNIFSIGAWGPDDLRKKGSRVVVGRTFGVQSASRRHGQTGQGVRPAGVTAVGQRVPQRARGDGRAEFL